MNLSFTNLFGTNLSQWVVIVVIGLITFGYRLSFILFSHRLNLSPTVQRALRFVPIAALTAIITPEVLRYSGKVDFSFSNERLIAAVIAAGVAWQTKNVLWTIASGMVTLWLLQLFLN